MATTPELLIVGGPNGSGKTTVAMEYSREYGLSYVSADAIASEMSPQNPASAQISAARQFIVACQKQISGHSSFVCESTLSGLTMQNVVVSAHQHGFVVRVAFLFVESPDICIARVAERVRKGGHNVPEVDIRRRFARSLHNFWTKYRNLADSWVLLYNGTSTLQDVAAGARQQITIRDPQWFAAFSQLAGESI